MKNLDDSVEQINHAIRNSALVRRKAEQVIAKGAHKTITGSTDAAVLDRLDWRNIRVFNAVAEAKSIRGAADALGLSASAVSARVRALEHETGSMLLVRHPAGVSLTAEGVKVYEIGKAMLRHARELAELSAKHRPGISNTVKVGATEGTGAFWLIPRMVDLEEDTADITIDFVLKMNPADVAQLEVDVAIQLDRPDDPELIVTHLGWIHVVLFASQEYLAINGEIDSVSDLTAHRFIEFAAPQIPRAVLAGPLASSDSRRFVRLRVNTSSAQLMAATYGAGVTALPNYSNILTNGLVHVAKDFVLKRDVWLVINPRAADLPQVRKVIKWLKRCFDQVRFPWFGEKFMAPTEVQQYLIDHGLVTMFSTFKDAARS